MNGLFFSWGCFSKLCYKQVRGDLSDPHLFLVMVFPVWYRCLFLSFFERSIVPGQNLYITVQVIVHCPSDAGEVLVWGVGLRLWSSCFVSPIYRSVHSLLHWTAYTTLLCLRLGIFSFGWTNFCLRVLEGLKCTRMICLLITFLSFLKSSSTCSPVSPVVKIIPRRRRGHLHMATN